MPIFKIKRQLEEMQSLIYDYREELTKLNTERKEHNQFVKAISELVKRENLTIVNVCKDKYGQDSYILMQDERQVFPLLEGKDSKYAGYYLKGSINFFVISEKMYIGSGLRFTEYPYLEATCTERGKLHIDNLFTQTTGLPYGRHGYGRMLIEAAESVCKKSGYTVMHGMLSSVDAQTESAKKQRNGFYEHLGFDMMYDSKQENGSFRKEIS